MAHLIDSMAYSGQTPWHGLANVLLPQQTLNVWLQADGMDWTIEQAMCCIRACLTTPSCNLPR